LFLTDLRGFDVVLGKLLATSLRGFYALLAVFPILAITLLMGGVTGAQFWKTALALVNALFLSLVAGLFVSAISRDSQKALAGTLLLLALLAGGGPAVDATIDAIQPRGFSPVLSLSSPVYLFMTRMRWAKPLLDRSARQPGRCLAAPGPGLPALALYLAGKSREAFNGEVGLGHWWKFGGAKRQTRVRRRLIDANPVLWLACRERWQAALLWVISLFMTVGAVAIFVSKEPSPGWWIGNYLSGLLMLALYLGIASHAGRFFVEAQHSGLMELLLATPLTSAQIVQGQWHALLRMLGPPLSLCLAAQCLGAVMASK